MAVRNALRTGLGLALAVAVTHVFPVEHGFWVVLGAMSVLRSSALTTGTKMLRAVLGTGIGFVLGAVLISVVGVDPAVLWILMPMVVFGSAFVPEIASFTAGQAAFTMMVLIFFNLIVPTGWSVGLIRVEDVVVGALVGVMVSLLLWPRGATASAEAAVESARNVFAKYLEAAVLRITRGAYEQMADKLATLSHDAIAASRVADDAVRQYLSEGGGDDRFPRSDRACLQPRHPGARRRRPDHRHPHAAAARHLSEGSRGGGAPRQRDPRSAVGQDRHRRSDWTPIGERVRAGAAGRVERRTTVACRGRDAAGDGGGRDRRTGAGVPASGRGGARPTASRTANARCGINAFGGMVPNLPAL